MNLLERIKEGKEEMTALFNKGHELGDPILQKKSEEVDELILESMKIQYDQLKNAG